MNIIKSCTILFIISMITGVNADKVTMGDNSPIITTKNGDVILRSKKEVAVIDVDYARFFGIQSLDVLGNVKGYVKRGYGGGLSFSPAYGERSSNSNPYIRYKWAENHRCST